MPAFPMTVVYIENFNTGIGVLLNSLLVFVIRRFSGPHLGTYKHLLSSFAVAGLLLLFFHVLVDAVSVSEIIQHYHLIFIQILAYDSSWHGSWCCYRLFIL